MDTNLTELLLSPDSNNAVLALVMATALTPTELFEEFDKLYYKLRGSGIVMANGAVGYPSTCAYLEAREFKRNGKKFRYKPTVVIHGKGFIYYFHHSKKQQPEMVMIDAKDLMKDNNEDCYRHYFKDSLPEDFMEIFKKHVLK